MNAARQFNWRHARAVHAVMQILVNDPNIGVRLIAASYLLAKEPDHTEAAQAIIAAREDPIPRVRDAAGLVLDSLAQSASALLIVSAMQMSGPWNFRFRSHLEPRVVMENEIRTRDMNLLHPRDPISTWTHFAGLVLPIFGTFWLLQHAQGTKRSS